MTPELKKACELVFQDHKASSEPINWHKDSFQGRLSFGMAALAKQTLENRNIICAVKNAKKTMTVLNPLAVSANSFEEAEEQVKNITPALVVNEAEDPVSFNSQPVSEFDIIDIEDTVQLLKVPGTPIEVSTEQPWWTKPFASYFLWPLCGAAAGAFITYLLSLFL
jgi:hypothetical protein